MTVRILHGDALEQLRTLADESVHSIVTDPPYELGFMGKAWDGTGIANSVELWTECLRVLKPGGYCLSFGSTRTFHRMVSAVEDAGFEIRDTISWNFGSGFPKSRNVSADLLAMPACQCTQVGDDARADVNPVTPSRTLAARVGTETPAMCLAGFAAEAYGVGTETGADSLRGQSVLQQRIEEAQGHLDPVVLGAPSVAVGAQRDEIAGIVGCIETDPESLRDQVMRDQCGSSAAVNAASVTLDNQFSDLPPSDTFVLPLPTAPSGIPASAQSRPVSDAHALLRTVSPGLAAADSVGLERLAASATTVDGHGNNGIRCESCAGVIRDRVPLGLGTALKPAMELICVARKPLAKGCTVAANVLAYGTGAINVDGCRVGFDPDDFAARAERTGTQAGRAYGRSGNVGYSGGELAPVNPAGRWPANLIHDGSDEVIALFPDAKAAYVNEDSAAAKLAEHKPTARRGVTSFDDGKPCSSLYTDSGSAARFFYTAKASRDDRNIGCDELEPTGRTLGHKRCAHCGRQKVNMPGSECQCASPEWIEVAKHSPRANHHPTVKPTDLMQYLVRLVTPPGGTVLDPFAGSGSTGLAADREGFDAILIERDAEYIEIAKRRIAGDCPLFADLTLGLPLEIAA